MTVENFIDTSHW